MSRDHESGWRETANANARPYRPALKKASVAQFLADATIWDILTDNEGFRGY